MLIRIAYCLGLSFIIVGCSSVKTSSVRASTRTDIPYTIPETVDNSARANFAIQGTVLQNDDYWKYGPYNVGSSASLWRDDFRNGFISADRRGIQVNDLVTILIYDTAEATTDAKTDVKSKSDVSATIEQFLGIPQWLFKRIDTYLSKDDSGNVDLTKPLVKGGSESSTKNEGTTERKGKIKATITALVTDITPSGLLRLEGRKHIKVNNEEQILVISGYARPEDIDSFNQLDSQRLANARIDFVGSGSVSSPQRGGWLSNLIRDLWPF